MSIIGAAIVPALQGYVSDYLGSMQRSFGVSLLCFAFVGYYFWGGELRHQERRRTALLAGLLEAPAGALLPKGIRDRAVQLGRFPLQ